MDKKKIITASPVVAEPKKEEEKMSILNEPFD